MLGGTKNSSLYLQRNTKMKNNAIHTSVKFNSMMMCCMMYV